MHLPDESSFMRSVPCLRACEVGVPDIYRPRAALVILRIAAYNGDINNVEDAD